MIHGESNMWHKRTICKTELDSWTQNRRAVAGAGLRTGVGLGVSSVDCYTVYSLHDKQKALLYSIGSYIQHLVINHNGKNLIRIFFVCVCIYIYIMYIYTILCIYYVI